MGNNRKATVEKLTWKQARSDVMAANPALAREIDALDPSDDYLLIKARYPFGSKILDKGLLHLPTASGEVLPITDARVDQKIAAMLTYAITMPMGVVLNNSIELYLTENLRTIPFGLMQTGKIFALWGVLDIENTESMHNKGRVWDIMAGARSLMMLPKISDVASYKRIKREFGLRSHLPKNYLTQWEVFKELAQHPAFPEPWSVELIFFTEKWLAERDDTRWKLFRYFLLETVWHNTAFLRNQVIVDFVLSCGLASKNLKPNPYLVDTLRHLYLIGVGALPGFVTAENDKAAPIAALQKIFNEIYDLRYWPTMVHPAYLLKSDAQKPCYYSLEFPTLAAFSPKSRQKSTKLENLKEIIHVMRNLNAYFLEDKLKLGNTPVYKWAQQIHYYYFHSKPEEQELILDCGKIISMDDALLSEQKKYPEKNFCVSSPFLRGCIRISK